MIDLSDLTPSERDYVMSFPADKRQAAAETTAVLKVGISEMVQVAAPASEALEFAGPRPGL